MAGKKRFIIQFRHCPFPHGFNHRFTESGPTLQGFVGLQFEGGTSLKFSSGSSTSQTNETFALCRQGID